jgi:pimeloyl-ACP methyl ester carboxylesterase
MTERTATVDVAGHSLFLHEWGEPAAPAVLFLHGSGDDGRQAAALAGTVAQDRRLVAPDLPGHGGSPRAHADSYRPSGVAALVVGLLDELGVAAAALVGFSWGASICCHVAARHPDRVRSLVLIEGGHVDFGDVRDFDPAALGADDDVATATARGLVDQPVVATYPALRQSRVPLLLVTALRDEALAQLWVDPLRRLREEVPQAAIARVPAGGHDLLERDDGTIARLIGERLAAGERGRSP